MTENELIERDKAIERFKNLAGVYDLALKDCNLEKEVYPHYEALMRGKKAVMELGVKVLMEAPVVSVRKTGRWVYKPRDYADGVYECSVCKEPYYLDGDTPLEHLYHYCPNCGAKMEN